MKRCGALVLAFGLVPSIILAQTAATPQAGESVVTPSPATQAAAPVPQLPEPSPRPTVPDLTRYLNRPDLLKFCTAQVAEFNHSDADMIFIGDSITQGWRSAGEAVWEANFVPRHALDFGVSGDQTQHVLWRLENYPIRQLHPKVAVILIGTNNLHNTAPEIAEGVKAVLTKTQEIFPGIKIILVSIMPNQRANDLMMATDAILRTFDDGKTIFYLDMVAVMTPVGDNWKGLSAGHLHPNASGYQLWADTMMPLLNKLLTPPVGTTAASK